MCTLTVLARMGVRNKILGKKGVKDSVNRMMQEPIANSRFMNIACLRVSYLKELVWRMSVSFINKFSVERNNIAHQLFFKQLDIFSCPFTPDKFFPSLEKIFERDDIIINMDTPLKTPPRTLFALCFGKD